MIKADPILPEPCSESDFEDVKKYIKEFELDNRELKCNEFLILKQKSNLIGFGRIRHYNGFSEMCSLGIIHNERNKGHGKILCQSLIDSTTTPLYLVCIIPTFFKDLGFSICESYPKEILDKLNYCTHSLLVEEKYVVMKYSK